MYIAILIPRTVESTAKHKNVLNIVPKVPLATLRLRQTIAAPLLSWKSTRDLCASYVVTQTYFLSHTHRPTPTHNQH